MTEYCVRRVSQASWEAVLQATSTEDAARQFVNSMSVSPNDEILVVENLAWGKKESAQYRAIDLGAESTTTPPAGGPETPESLVNEYGEPYQTRCPFCAEVILSTARKCKHCGEWLGADTVNHRNGLTSPPQSTGSDGQVSAAAVFGTLLLLIGVVWAIFAMNIDTTVSGGVLGERVHNIGLMNEKQSHLIFGGLAALLGVGLLAIAALRRR